MGYSAVPDNLWVIQWIWMCHAMHINVIKIDLLSDE